MSEIGPSKSKLWFRPFVSNGEATQELFVFPHAGGGMATFRNWPKYLRGSIRVNALQLAGRESRYCEAPTSDWAEVVQEASQAIAATGTTPPILFGHSMGAMLAHEVARELWKSYGVETGALMVSGRPAPQLPARTPALAHLPDQILVERLNLVYQGIPPEVLKDGEMVRMMARVLRGDLTLVERYRYAAGDALKCPIAAFGGVDDPWATREELASWREMSVGGFSLELFAGGHFYLRDEVTERALLRRIAAVCEGIAGAQLPLSR